MVAFRAILQSVAVASFVLLLQWSPALAFQTPQRMSPTRHSPRTNTHLQMTLHANRRHAIISLIATAGGLLLQTAIPATAAAASSPTAAASTTKNTPFDAIRFELYDPTGGVALMQQRIDDRDFEGLMEFTKGYDQVLRKQYMGKAKKLLPKELQDKATMACNSVTFDLIGMNRNSRKGQESYDGVQKYLNELKQDAESLLALESSVVVPEKII